MPFRITALPLDAFRPLFALDDAALADLGARRLVAGVGDDWPCRVNLTTAQPGERVILANYEHQPAATPYRARGPVFVREAAAPAPLAPGEVPPGFRASLLSVRAYSDAGMIVAAEVILGKELEGLAQDYLARSDVGYLHLHYARRGCYAARLDRA